ncbi:galactose-specific lectin nattectin-like [Micropterus dolomieu]|uniref:galactose-specific lectin nattectin-like n=1 Tax=Micropterus dolomieu TaxID=147949 RepID=UPI001E8DD6A2|nr:galactose-specific lectin nattectin-like [Micropterus dolomieu]
MASALHFIAVLCLTSGLCIGANASSETESDHCYKTCPDGWTVFGQQCYMFHNSEQQWADAERLCTSFGGNLASLQTADEYKFIREMIRKVTGVDKAAWVGGYDAAKEGVWLWSDGSKYAFKGWAAGEPNNAGGRESCMEINFAGKDYVNDANCDINKSIVCGMRL